ncbi:MAG TPA: flagellar hook-length control protein FliK [Rhizomicrobium sp.]|nr:flagellar hook-length control protein FliK [Rhizomicrobium sp.]
MHASAISNTPPALQGLAAADANQAEDASPFALLLAALSANSGAAGGTDSGTGQDALAGLLPGDAAAPDATADGSADALPAQAPLPFLLMPAHLPSPQDADAVDGQDADGKPAANDDDVAGTQTLPAWLAAIIPNVNPSAPPGTPAGVDPDAQETDATAAAAQPAPDNAPRQDANAAPGKRDALEQDAAGTDTPSTEDAPDMNAPGANVSDVNVSDVNVSGVKIGAKTEDASARTDRTGKKDEKASGQAKDDDSDGSNAAAPQVAVAPPVPVPLPAGTGTPVPPATQPAPADAVAQAAAPNSVQTAGAATPPTPQTVPSQADADDADPSAEPDPAASRQAAPDTAKAAPKTPAPKPSATPVAATKTNGVQVSANGAPTATKPASPADGAQTQAQASPQPASQPPAAQTQPQVLAAQQAAAQTAAAPQPAKAPAISTAPHDGTAHADVPGIQVTAAAPNLHALAVDIAARSQSGTKQFDIRLDPPELGRVEVRLSIDATGKASAHLTADQPQTLDLLQKDAPVLTRALRDAGLDVSQNGLNFSLRQQQNGHAFAGGGDQSGGRQMPRGALPLEAGRPLETAGGTTSYRLRAEGRVDISV